ncbi:hypothetical protein [Streptomyces sp. NPDC055186]
MTTSQGGQRVDGRNPQAGGSMFGAPRSTAHGHLDAKPNTCRTDRAGARGSHGYALLQQVEESRRVTVEDAVPHPALTWLTEEGVVKV